MTRSRRRGGGKRGGGRQWSLLAVLVVAILAGVATAYVPSGAFTSVGLDRSGAMDVSLDGGGALQLSVMDCMDDNGWNDMVTITNRLNATADVTVSLQDSTDGSIKGGSGGSRTVTLAQAESGTFEFKYDGNGPYPDTVDFDVSAVGTDTVVTADATRSSAVSTDGTCSGMTTTTTSTTTTEDSSGPNEPPTADFTYVRQNKNFVDLDGSSSFDPDGTIVSYEWDVGNDGTVDHTGQTVTKVRARSGTDVRLIVTDDDGATDSVVYTV